MSKANLNKSDVGRISAGKAWFNMTSKGGVYFVEGKRALYADLFMFGPGPERHVVYRPGITPEKALAVIGGKESRERSISKALESFRDDMGRREGRVLQRLSTAYVRDRNARRQCIARYGARCFVCDFSFKDRYGNVADGFIHVHHLLPLSDIHEEHEVDAVKHLRPVCPNCHAVLHLRNPVHTIEEVQAFLRP